MVAPGSDILEVVVVPVVGPEAGIDAVPVQGLAPRRCPFVLSYRPLPG